MQGKKEAQMHKNNKMLRINEEKGEKNIGRMKKKEKEQGKYSGTSARKWGESAAEYSLPVSTK